MIPESLTTERTAFPTSLQIVVRTSSRAAHFVSADRLLSTLSIWWARATHRHALSVLGDDLLRDIGLMRPDVDNEVRKPFWRA